uniref:Putative LAGLIDADG homing endonuclease n=1 Tax=Bulbochaete rectangularis var. hiloensis TaxID=55990 RepID=A0A6M4SP45_9CHLO|nr:putative LAGLIDADG homing endonuclease [Bulbochaete rectangularis var. hiloensis]
MPSSINKEERKISPEWLLGFTEAEGTFAIDINDAKDMRLGKKVKLSFMMRSALLDDKLLHDAQRNNLSTVKDMLRTLAMLEAT